MSYNPKQKQALLLVQDEPRGPSILVEIPIKSNGLTTQQLPDVQQLRSTTDLSVFIKAIRLITADVLSNGVTQSGVNAPIAELKKMVLVLYAEGWEKARYIPLLVLNDVQSDNFPHRYHATRFDDWGSVDWSKSYVQFANGQSSANSPYNVILEVEYFRLDRDGNLVTTAQ